jgi:hypothetical protein
VFNILISTLSMASDKEGKVNSGKSSSGLKEWQRIRSAGRLNFAIRQGSLFATIVLIWVYLVRFALSGEVYFPELQVLMAEWLAGFAVASLGYGTLMWKANEWIRKQSLPPSRRKEEEQESSEQETAGRSL